MTLFLTLLHRWLGVLFCLLFAMWFATGIVMHFVPFPALTEAERIDGLAPIDASRVLLSSAEAMKASTIPGVSRLRLFERVDGPVFVVAGTSGLTALHAEDLSSARVPSERLAVAIATAHAQRRGLEAAQVTFAELAAYDQWTVPNALDRHRPLYRIALNDPPGTELYVSSTTGEVVRDTTRSERWWNYAGSVAHWIYPTILRRSARLWDATVWTLSLVALIAASAGALLGTLRLKVERRRLVSPYRGWHAWHHTLGLACMTFVLTWIFSGWLSMDSGRLFSTGKLTEAEATMAASAPAWDSQSTRELRSMSTQAKEVEWFVFGGRFYRRERLGLKTQHLFSSDLGADKSAPLREFLRPDEVDALTSRIAIGCNAAVVVAANDNYPVRSTMPDAPVYRAVCADSWLHVDGANGAFLEKLDGSRRAYRWFYSALHTFDVPGLVARPVLRAMLIVVLCGCGLAFSFTAIIIAARRLRLGFGFSRGQR